MRSSRSFWIYAALVSLLGVAIGIAEFGRGGYFDPRYGRVGMFGGQVGAVVFAGVSFVGFVVSVRAALMTPKA